MAITDKSLLLERMKVNRSVKTVEQYIYIIQVLTNWGDDTVLAAAPSDDHDTATVRSFFRKHIQGYSYIKHFKIEEAQSIDGSPKIILKHKKSGGGVGPHMLDVFDVINEAHSRQGLLKVDKILANCKSQFYGPTHKLCTLFIRFCFVCHQSHPRVDAWKGAKEPILSSEFRNHFQVVH
jgi:hypothetical protein